MRLLAAAVIRRRMGVAVCLLITLAAKFGSLVTVLSESMAEVVASQE